jgi:hypothetical protein
MTGRKDSTGVPLRVWDVATGRQVRALACGGSGPHGVAYSPDGRLLAAATWGGALRVWDAASGKEVFTLDGPRAQAHVLAFSPDGRTLASGGYDGVVRLWEAASGQERGRLEGQAGFPVALAFAPDGRALASGSMDSTVVLWDPRGCSGARAAPPGGFPAAELEALGDALGGDAPAAYRAMVELESMSAQAVPLLGRRLRPKKAEPGRVARLIRGLDSDRFAARDEATAALRDLGEAVEPALQAAVAAGPSAEARRRIRGLLEHLHGPVRMRGIRGVEVLEQVGTPEARELLSALAAGSPEARLTGEAKAALARLTKRPAGPAP